MRRIGWVLLAVACLGASRSVARADVGKHDEPAPQPGFAALYDAPGMVPSIAEERARWAVATSGELAHSLRSMPRVVDARVHVALPDASLDALDDAPRAARASVLVIRRAGAPPLDEGALRSLVTGAVDGLPDERVAILQAEAAAPHPPEIVRVGPLRVTAASAATARLLLGAMLVTNAALALLVAGVVARRRRHPRRP